MVVMTLFTASLVTGGLGIYLGSQFVLGEADPVNALVTGLLGAIIWVVAGTALGWIPVLGQVFVLGVYTWMVNRRYPGDWSEAIRIALVAWLVTLLVLGVLAGLGYATYEAIGVPFA